MRRRFDVGVCHQHRAIRSHEIRDTLGERDQSASGANRLRQLMVAVAEQAERQSVFLGEFPVLLRRVIRDTENFDAEFLEFVPAVPQLVGFERSTGGAGLWIEEEQKRPPLEIGARYRGAVLGFEFEIDKRLSDRNHLSSSSVSDRGRHQH